MALSAPSVPTDLAASENTTSSISLAWNSASSATAYDLQWSSDGENWNELTTGVAGTSYTWTGLTAGTSYFVRVRAINPGGNSDWSDAVSVATEAVHSHNGITFEKWNSTNALPTEGNYFLANDVACSGDPTVPVVELTGNLNLCLNGNTADLGYSYINVPSGKTLTIFDDAEGGKITSYFPGLEGIYFAGVITVQSGGTLILGEGSIENTYVYDSEDPDYKSIAIASAGTFKLSGAPAVSGNDIDLYIVNTNVITIESGKPLTNSSPYTVSRTLAGTITSGWANMGGANPANFFSSAKSGYPAVILEGGEAKLVSALTLSDSEDNSGKIGNGVNQTSMVIVLNRSFTSASYNTLCLPFGLTNAQLQEVFGAGYSLQSFQGSSFDGETVTLSFASETSVEAGVPYLIQPSVDVVNPTFNGVTIPLGQAVVPAAVTSTFIDFQGVFSPTDVGSGKNILFLGAGNELFWNSNSSGELKGFRAFFTAKGDARQAVRARIVQKTDAATGIENLSPALPTREGAKFLRSGQLIIERNGHYYNAQGQQLR